MDRNELIYAILANRGEGQENWDLYERYSTSQLKAILDDILTVKFQVTADGSIIRVAIIAGVFIVLGIVLLKRL